MCVYVRGCVNLFYLMCVCVCVCVCKFVLSDVCVYLFYVCVCALQMTSIVLPGMLERKRGTIINISSAAGLRPMPFFTTYSASKVRPHTIIIIINFYSVTLEYDYCN